MTIALLALLISVVAIPGPWAQTTRVLRKRSIDGLATQYLMLNTWAAILWTVYGFADHDKLQLIVNSSTAIASLLILVWACRNQAFSTKSTTISLVACISVATGLSIWGAQAVGLLASSIVILSRLPQIVKAWKEPGGNAISLTSLAIATSAALGWTAYGMLCHDIFVVTTSMYVVVFSLFVMARTLQGRRYEQFELQPA